MGNVSKIQPQRIKRTHEVYFLSNQQKEDHNPRRTQSISNILVSIFFMFFQKQIEIANQGVVLCCMCPGFTDTAFVQNLEDKIIDFPAAYQAIEKMGLLKYDFSSHERKK